MPVIQKSIKQSLEFIYPEIKRIKRMNEIFIYPEIKRIKRMNEIQNTKHILPEGNTN